MPVQFPRRTALAMVSSDNFRVAQGQSAAVAIRARVNPQSRPRYTPIFIVKVFQLFSRDL